MVWQKVFDEECGMVCIGLVIGVQKMRIKYTYVLQQARVFTHESLRLLNGLILCGCNHANASTLVLVMTLCLCYIAGHSRRLLHVTISFDQ